MATNFYMYFVAALIPMIVGAIYYHPKVVGTAWMKANHFTEDTLKEGNMAIIFGMAYLYSAMLALVLGTLVIHQASVAGLLIPEAMEPGHPIQKTFNELMEQFGNRHRSFGHGAVHGVLLSLFFALPMVGINALFERRGWKYILIHFIYWLITLVSMGGLLCQTLEFGALS
ncbi:MAG: DUF1761 domain-containing protein [Bacteroidota bacterium]